MGNSRTFDLLATTPRVVRANFYPFRPGEVVGPHCDHGDLFICATQGKAAISFMGENYNVDPGCIVHVPWGELVRYEADRAQPLSMTCLHFWYLPWSEPPVTVYPRTYNATIPNPNPWPRTPTPFEHPFCVSTKKNSRIFDVAGEIANIMLEEHSGEFDREEFLRGASLEFITSVRHLVNGDQTVANHPLAEVVHEIASWMELRIASKITRDEIVARAGVSESTITNAFRAVTGKSPIAFLIELRMSHARKLLRFSTAKISAVAREVGIPDAAYFSKLFTERNGMPPMEYRLKNPEGARD